MINHKPINIFILIILIVQIVYGGSSSNYGSTGTTTTSFKGYRMLQFDHTLSSSSSIRFGPQRSTLSAQTIRYQPSTPLQQYSSLIVVIGFEDLNVTLLQSLLDQSILGLIVIVKSSSSSSPLSNLTISSISKLTINIPIYFVEEGDIEKEKNMIGGDLRLVTEEKTRSPSPISQWNIINFSGRLVGQADKADSIVPPTVLVVAHYDCFSKLAPSLPSSVAMEQSTGGAVALMELSRIFSKLYSNIDNQPAYNIIFLLTSGSATNFEGAEHWIDQQSPVISESIDLVVCIDSFIGGGGDLDGELYLHVSRPPKDNATRQLYSDFTKSSTAFGSELNIIQKKINISSPIIYWEHEVFSRKRIPAMTISQRKQPFDQLVEPLQLVGSNGANTNTKTLARNIRIIAKAIMNHIYSNDNISKDILLSETSILNVNEALLNSWMSSLSRVIRSLPFIDQLSPSQSSSSSSSSSSSPTMINSIEKFFKTYLMDVVVESSKSSPSSQLVFYNPTTVTLSFHNVKSFTFDIMILIGCIVYLLLIYLALRGKEGLNDFKSFIF